MIDSEGYTKPVEITEKPIDLVDSGVKNDLDTITTKQLDRALKYFDYIMPIDVDKELFNTLQSADKLSEEALKMKLKNIFAEDPQIDFNDYSYSIPEFITNSYISSKEKIVLDAFMFSNKQWNRKLLTVEKTDRRFPVVIPEKEQIFFTMMIRAYASVVLKFLPDEKSYSNSLKTPLSAEELKLIQTEMRLGKYLNSPKKSLTSSSNTLTW